MGNGSKFLVNRAILAYFYQAFGDVCLVFRVADCRRDVSR